MAPMVSVDTSTGRSVGVSGAALAGGPALLLSPGRRLLDVARVSGLGGGAFPSLLRRAAPAAPPAEISSELPAVREDVLPSRWGIPAFYGGAAFGPPYELMNRTAEWELSAETAQSYFQTNRQARMAQRVHPRGPALQTARSLFSTLYDLSPTPPHLGVGVDAVR